MKNNLVAMDNKTWKPIAVGDEVISFRGEKATFVGYERRNEFRYGGGKSGKVAVRWPGDMVSMEYYDKVFDITVIDTEAEKMIS